MTRTDAEQASLLDLIDSDPIHSSDADRIKAAILADGRAHDGRIDQNRVRRALTNNGGGLDVYPRCVGPAYNALCRKQLIKPLGYVDVNGDHAGRNAGKPAMAYELTEDGWSA